jgi:hypothetical protein
MRYTGDQFAVKVSLATVVDTCTILPARIHLWQILDGLFFWTYASYICTTCAVGSKHSGAALNSRD